MLLYADKQHYPYSAQTFANNAHVVRINSAKVYHQLLEKNSTRLMIFQYCRLVSVKSLSLEYYRYALLAVRKHCG